MPSSRSIDSPCLSVNDVVQAVAAYLEQHNFRDAKTLATSERGCDIDAVFHPTGAATR